MPKDSPHPVKARSVSKLTKAGFLLAFLALSSVFAARLFASGNAETAPPPKAIVVSTETINIQESYIRSRSFTGRATAKRRSRLGFEMAGTLLSMTFDDGDQFKKGDILARLDTSRLNAKLIQLKAQAAELDAAGKFAQSTYDRILRTNKQGHASAQLLDEAYSNLVASKARSEAQSAAIMGLEIDLVKSVVTAPFDGIVTARFIDEGSIVSAGLTVFDVTETSRIEAKIGVSPAIAQTLNGDSNFRLINNQRQRLDGRFINIVNSIRGQTRTMLATFDLNSAVADGAIITLVIDDPIVMKGAWVPVRALSSDVRGLWRLYKVLGTPTGPEIAFENVQLLHSSGDMAYVSGSFSNGDMIVREGVSKLAKGQRINPVPFVDSTLQ